MKIFISISYLKWLVLAFYQLLVAYLIDTRGVWEYTVSFFQEICLGKKGALIGNDSPLYKPKLMITLHPIQIFLEHAVLRTKSIQIKTSKI
jgi:hypothetical protein